jgi:outer membrane protein TolC
MTRITQSLIKTYVMLDRSRPILPIDSNTSPNEKRSMDAIRPMLSLLLLVFFMHSAISATPPVSLTWEDCVKEATDKNPTVAAAVAAVSVADAQYKGSYSNFFPQLTASAGFTESDSYVAGVGGANTGPSGLPSIGSYQSAPQGQFSVGVTATQSIFNGFQDVGKVKQGKANLEAARAALALAKSALSNNLKNAFATLLYQQESVDLALAILKREQKNLRLVTMNYEGGQDNKGNQMYQAATVAQAQWQYDHSIRQVVAAAKSLAPILGRPESDNVTVTGKLGARPLERNVDMKSLVARHPQHVQYYYQEVSADAAVTIANQGWYPNVNASAFYGSVGSSFIPQDQRWSVGLSVSFPFFPGTSQIFGAEAARASKVQAQYNTSNTDLNLLTNLEQAYAGLDDALQQVQVDIEFQDADIVRSKIATEKYNNGLMTFEDWTVIETDLITRQQNLLSAELSAMQAEATWEQAKGTGAIP